MKGRNFKLLLIPLLFVALIALNIGSAEAAESAAVVVWVNTSSTSYTGPVNITINVSNVVGADDGAGLCNATFTLTGQDGVAQDLGTLTNATENQTTFSLLLDSTKFPDQIYTLDGSVGNCSDSLAFGADATQLTAVVFDNADLTMSWEETTSDYNDTLGGFCPKDEILYFGINGSSDEMMNIAPTLYFKSAGSSSTYTKSSTVTRGAASLNYTTTTNNTYSSLIDLPTDIYTVWVTYQDTDGTDYNTAKLDITIICDGMGPAPLLLELEEEEEADTKQGLIIIVAIIVGLWILSRLSGK